MLEYVIPVSAAIAALVMVYLILNLLKQETGNKRMQEIAGAIREGAFAFLGRQYKTTGMHAIVVAIVLFFISHQNGIATAVTGNLRVAAGAKHSLNRALQIAFRSGAVTGLAVTTLSLIGVWVLFHAFGGASGALKEMVLPGVLVVAAPVIVGLWLKWEAVGGFLMVSTITGVIMALFLNTGGGAWDNAKKYIETGAHGGKRSDPHKAAVVGDTVGDPFKDTAGPSLHVLIKLLSTITLVLASLFV